MIHSPRPTVLPAVNIALLHIQNMITTGGEVDRPSGSILIIGYPTLPNANNNFLI